MPDIFEFWSQVERGTFMHPSDQKVFERINPKRHGFQLNCLPGCFGGPLLSAPVVLLYLSPGFSKADVADAKTDEGKDYRFRSQKGKEPFRDSGPGKVWLASRTKIFGDYDSIKGKIAVLNIGAYHSSDVKSWPPSFVPRAFAALSAAFTRLLIMLASSSATATI